MTAADAWTRAEARERRNRRRRASKLPRDVQTAARGVDLGRLHRLARAAGGCVGVVAGIEHGHAHCDAIGVRPRVYATPSGRVGAGWPRVVRGRCSGCGAWRDLEHETLADGTLLYGGTPAPPEPEPYRVVETRDVVLRETRQCGCGATLRAGDVATRTTARVRGEGVVREWRCALVCTGYADGVDDAASSDRVGSDAGTYARGLRSTFR